MVVDKGQALLNNTAYPYIAAMNNDVNVLLIIKSSYLFLLLSYLDQNTLSSHLILFV